MVDLIELVTPDFADGKRGVSKPRHGVSKNNSKSSASISWTANSTYQGPHQEHLVD
jgi:hypothetical protein